MLLYMYGHTRTDLSLAVNIRSRYMFSPKLSHKLTLKRLVNYLNQTKDRDLVLNPNYDVCKVDAYPYANSYGMCGNEKPTDP